MGEAVLHGVAGVVIVIVITLCFFECIIQLQLELIGWYCCFTVVICGSVFIVGL